MSIPIAFGSLKSPIMSQPTPQDLRWLSIPFEKYSHNTSRTGTRKYTWSHIGPGKDLKLDVHNFRGVDEHGNYTSRVVMKILSGTEVLVGLILNSYHAYLLNIVRRKAKI